MLIRFKTGDTDVFVRSTAIVAIGTNGDGDTIIRVDGLDIPVLEKAETVFRMIDEAGDRLDKFEAIRKESTGVDGFHLNGEVATWSELGL